MKHVSHKNSETRELTDKELSKMTSAMGDNVRSQSLKVTNIIQETSKPSSLPAAKIPLPPSNRENPLRPKLIIIAGPNGSGKTTFTPQMLEHDWADGCLFINPDVHTTGDVVILSILTL